jgi:hypothetical protein
VFECLRRLESGEGREAVRGYQVDVGKLYCQLWTVVCIQRSCGFHGPTHEVIGHLRARIGRIVGLIHAVHCCRENATAMPRVSMCMTVLCVDAIAGVGVVILVAVAFSARQGPPRDISQPIRTLSPCTSQMSSSLIHDAIG